MSKESIPVGKGIAVLFRIDKNGEVQVDDNHSRINEEGEWEKGPRRPKIAFHLKEMSGCEMKAAEIVQNPNLGDHQKKSVVDRLSQFFDTALKLDNHIRTPSGNVDVSVDSVELRNLWHLYLVRGREVVDEVGRKIKICFELKQGIKGLNREGFGKLTKILSQEMRKRPDLEALIRTLEEFEQPISEFIELRNRDKTHNDTLSVPPAVSPHGIPNGGQIINRDNKKQYVFCEYFRGSFDKIMEFSKAILG